MPRPLARLRGALDALLADPRHAAHEDAWVEVTLTDVVRPAQAMERLRRRFPHTLVLGFDARGRRRSAPPVSRRPRRAPTARSPLAFMSEMRGEAPTTAETELLHTAVDACCDDRDVDLLLGEGD